MGVCWIVGEKPVNFLVALLAHFLAASVVAFVYLVCLELAPAALSHFWAGSFFAATFLSMTAFHAPRPTRMAPMPIVELMVRIAPEEFSDASAPWAMSAIIPAMMRPPLTKRRAETVGAYSF